MLNYYKTDNVKEICHKVKQSDISAISIIADYLSHSLPKSAILVPAPSHTGQATYTLEICKEISRKNKNKIADILRRTPSKTLYELKKRGEVYLNMYLTEPTKNYNYLFIDNVISTGLTFNTAKALIPNLSPLVFAYT